MILAILQARVSSSRLPGKVLKPILGKPMLQHQIDRILRSKRVSKLVVATSISPSDDPLEKLCRDNGIDFFRGNLDDVLDRYYQAAQGFRPEHVVRLTGDCPLADPSLIDEVIGHHLDSQSDYTSNNVEPTYPDGLDVEVFRFSALKRAWREAKTGPQREHVTPYLYGNPGIFKITHHKDKQDLSHFRWTVDEPKDFEFIEKIYETLYSEKPDFSTSDVLRLLEKQPELLRINQNIARNEGYKMSLRKEQLRNRYKNSEAMLARALNVIPLGSQTFSKSKTQYPQGVSPYFIKSGSGGRVWDIDDNEYVDFVNGLCAINLGYNDPDISAAVRAQLDSGVIFTLPHPLETEVAEQLVEMVPSAEMVRFGKNGSDATAGAIRLARGYTRRDHVLVCGYHGWQDWYIGSTARNLGVPRAVRELTHTFAYNDLESLAAALKAHEGDVAAVILEPMNSARPKEGFLQGVRDLAHKAGAVLIFDETITGFRFANGGAQEYFGVTPDLTTLGKGIANGYPVSAIVGRAEIMKLMEEVFFSFTFGGEALSLAAASANLKKLRCEPVIQTMANRGESLLSGLEEIIKRQDASDFLTLSGHPAWSFFTIKDAGKYTSWQLKTLYLQEMFARGILTLGTHNISYAHTSEDISKLVGAYEEVVPLLVQAVRENALEKLLLCKPLEPLFKLR